MADFIDKHDANLTERKNMQNCSENQGEALLHKDAYCNFEPNDKAAELLRQNDAFIKQVELQAARVAASVMKSFDSLPTSYQEEMVKGLKKDLGPHDVVYHAFLKSWEAKQA